jgi:hypothetical protein
MKRLLAMPFAAWLCLAPVGVAAAQANGSAARENELALLAGFSRSNRLDATASPMPFAGLEHGFLVKYDRSLHDDQMLISLASSFHAGRFSPANASSPAVEHLNEGEVRAALLRHVSGPHGSRFAVGVAGTAGVSLTQHHYADPTSRVSDFVIGATTLGPEATWTAPLGAGALKIDITSPVVGLIDHPYSDSRSGSALTHLRLAGPGAYQRASGAVTYMSRERYGAGVLYTYRYERLTYGDVQPLHTSSHTFLIGVTKKLGKDSP